MVARKLTARGWIALTALLALETASAVAQTPARSFADLQSVVRIGQRVSVIEHRGDVTTITEGEVVSIAPDKLEIAQPILFFRGRTYVFSETSVSRIESAQRIWKGAVIGTAVGALTAVAIGHARGWHPEQTGMVLTLTSSAGGFIGHHLEESKQQRLLYVSPTRVPTPLPRTPKRPFIEATVRF